MISKIAFIAAESQSAQDAKAQFIARYGGYDVDKADIIVALGGDGFMLNTLRERQKHGQPIYGINFGTTGFLMNAFNKDDLIERVNNAEETQLSPLHMCATTHENKIYEALAINEVSLLRAGSQAAKLRILIDGKERMPSLVCDGALLCTPAGSTAYNYSAHGPILPINSNILALTAVAAHRPRRWRGAILPETAAITFEVLSHEKRPVIAGADSCLITHIIAAEIKKAKDITHHILFDPGHGMDERLIREQFV